MAKRKKHQALQRRYQISSYFDADAQGWTGFNGWDGRDGPAMNESMGIFLRTLGDFPVIVMLVNSGGVTFSK